MKRLLQLLVLTYACAFAQQPTHAQYAIVRAVTLSGSGEAVTIQQPASASRRVLFVAADVYCSVSCDVTLERDGTAATATAGTIAKINIEAPTAKALVFTASDVGVGTVIGKRTIPAGAIMAIDLNDKWLQGDGTGINLTIRVSSISGDAKINIYWREQ